jgi:hypothetical protein
MNVHMRHVLCGCMMAGGQCVARRSGVEEQRYSLALLATTLVRPSSDHTVCPVAADVNSTAMGSDLLHVADSMQDKCARPWLSRPRYVAGQCL